MKAKYLETEKFPKAILAVTHLELPKNFAPGSNLANAAFKGTLTLKGVQKPVEGTVNISGPKLATTAEFSFSLNDYPVGVPSYLGVTVADRIQVQATLPELARK
jgi:polyisoprenoid-binding protein YceI